MRALVRAVADLEPGELEAWRDLAGRALQPNPMFEPECLVPAARHLAGNGAISLVVAEDAGRWHACVPVRRAPSWRALRRPVLTSVVRRMIYDGTPLVDAERSTEALACLLDGLRTESRAGRAGIAVLDWVDDGPVVVGLVRAARSADTVLRLYEIWERPMARRRARFDPRSQHSRKFLYNVRRMRRRLGEAEGASVGMTDRSDAAEAVDLVLRLESGGYKGTSGLAVDTFPGEREWFTAMCDGFRDEGRLHLYTLDVGRRVVAAQLLVTGGDGLFLLKTVYDEAYRAYSPGIQLHLDVVGHVHEATRAAWIDTCTYPGNDTLLRLYPDRHAVASVVVATGGVMDRSVLRAVTAGRRALGRDRRTAGPVTGRATSSAAPPGRSAAPPGRSATAAVATAAGVGAR